MSVFCTGVVDGPIANKSFRNGKVFPCLINGKRAFAAWDMLSDICCADPSMFKALGISATKGNVLLLGIVKGAKATGLKYAEDVCFVSTQGKVSANLLCHPIGRGRIILSDKVANDLGVTFSLPIGFPTLDPQSDKEWAKTQPVWKRSLEIACQRRTSFRCKRNKGIYYQKFRCNQEGGG